MEQLLPHHQEELGPYAYDWYNAPTNSGDSLVTDLCASEYNVAVSDANGCLDTASVIITGPAGFTARVMDTSMVSCNGLSDGYAVAFAEGGKAPYNYLWNDLLATENDSVIGLAEGDYSVVVSDDNGCNAIASVSITQPEVLEATITSTSPTSCSSTCTGEATVGALEEQGLIIISGMIYHLKLQKTANNLCAAQYSVQVTDLLGCKDTAVTLIVGPDNLTVAIDSIVNASCKGNCDGSVAITPMGGVGGYSYVWDDPSATEDTILSGLCSGNINAQITDANGCVAFANVVIGEPDELVVSIADSF